ncbi:MAG: MopE-related protein, partial [Chitinophagaceae bacterium]
NFSSFDSTDFDISVDFRLNAFAASGTPVIVGGTSFRWIGIYVKADSSMGILFNNSIYRWSATKITTGQWYTAVLRYHNGAMELWLNSTLILTQNIGPLICGNNFNFTTNNFSNGTALNGCIRNLKIYNGEMCGAVVNVLSTYYRDADNDGYGNAGNTTTTCSSVPPVGYVTTNTDCNDTNAAVHPDATEICGNAIDDNCNRQVNEDCANIYTIAGNGTDIYGDNVQATSTGIGGSRGVAIDSRGNIYIAESDRSRIRKINTSGIITTIAGTGTQGYNGDNIPAINAQLNQPTGVTVDKNGNVYIADQPNNRIRKIDTAGIITTIAGNGTFSFSGDGGPASSAGLFLPTDITIDSVGNIYIADGGNHRIRKINTTGIITTIAGTGIQGYNGDNIQATTARLYQPATVAVSNGNIYIADQTNNRIRKINSSGIITTIAGTGIAGNSGEGGLAITAMLNNPWGVYVDKNENIYLSDAANHTIKKISSTGILTTVAGIGLAGFSGEGGPATSARLYYPHAITQDLNNNLYIADYATFRIRKVGNLPNYIYYKDADGDNYGTPADTIKATSKPAGYASNSSDCNDNDATTYPGAPELCDGKDNNCDGIAEALQTSSQQIAGTIPSARSYPVGFTINNKVYTGGGADGFGKNDFWEYNPATNVWTQKSDIPAGSGVALAVSFAIGTKGYISTGYMINSGNTAQTWEYDPATNVWTRKADLPSDVRERAMGFSLNGKGYVGGGIISSSNTLLSDFWEFDPSQNSWTRKADIGGGARHFGVGFSIGLKGYIGVGGTSSTFNNSAFSSSDFWEYDPFNNNWVQKANVPGGDRTDAVGFSIDNKGYIGTGRNFSGVHKKDMWQYDPINSTWTQLNDFGGTERSSAIGITYKNKAYIGFGSNSGNQSLSEWWDYVPGCTQAPILAHAVHYPAFEIAANTAISLSTKEGIYPNPAKDKITIKSEGALNSQNIMQIIDVSGKMYSLRSVKNTSHNMVEMDISHLNKGVYLVKIKSGKNNKTVRFVKL